MFAVNLTQSLIIKANVGLLDSFFLGSNLHDWILLLCFIFLGGGICLCAGCCAQSHCAEDDIFHCSNPGIMVKFEQKVTDKI